MADMSALLVSLSVASAELQMYVDTIKRITSYEKITSFIAFDMCFVR